MSVLAWTYLFIGFIQYHIQLGILPIASKFLCLYLSPSLFRTRALIVKPFGGVVFIDFPDRGLSCTPVYTPGLAPSSIVRS